MLVFGGIFHTTSFFVRGVVIFENAFFRIFKNDCNSPAQNHAFSKKKKNPGKKIQNCRGKLTFKVAITHLALRSPMFGEFCISFFLGEFQWN